MTAAPGQKPSFGKLPDSRQSIGRGGPYIAVLNPRLPLRPVVDVPRSVLIRTSFPAQKIDRHQWIRQPDVSPANGGSAEQGCAGRVVGIDHLGSHGLQSTPSKNDIKTSEHQAQADSTRVS